MRNFKITPVPLVCMVCEAPAAERLLDGCWESRRGCPTTVPRGTWPGELWCSCTEERGGTRCRSSGSRREHSSMQHPMLLLLEPWVSGRQSWPLGRGWGSPAIPGHTARWVEPRPGAGRSVSLCAWLSLSMLLSRGESIVFAGHLLSVRCPFQVQENSGVSGYPCLGFCWDWHKESSFFTGASRFLSDRKDFGWLRALEVCLSVCLWHVISCQTFWWMCSVVFRLRSHFLNQQVVPFPYVYVFAVPTGSAQPFSLP